MAGEKQQRPVAKPHWSVPEKHTRSHQLAAPLSGSLCLAHRDCSSPEGEQENRAEIPAHKVQVPQPWTQTNKETDRQTDKQTGRQTAGLTDE